MKKLVVLLGVTGAGKDTQAKLLEDKYGYTVIRVGDKVRAMANRDAKIQAELKEGVLAEPDTVDEIMSSALRQAPNDKPLLSDGYPRDMNQTHKLEEFCSQLEISIDKVLFITIPEEEVYARLAKRGRDDDKHAIIAERIAVYKTQTMPVVEYYRSKNMLVEIDGSGSEADVFARIEAALQD